MFAVVGKAGSGLIALDDGGAELSMFASVTLAAELIRAVPATHELAGTRAALLDQTLGGDHGGRDLSGRLPLGRVGRVRPGGGPDWGVRTAAGVGVRVEVQR